MRAAFLNVDLVDTAKNEARGYLTLALQQAQGAGELPDKEIPAFAAETPADAQNGDIASNIALVSAKAFGMPPRKIAEIIAAHMQIENSCVSKIEVAGPGFINMFLSGAWFGSVIMAALLCEEKYGCTNVGGGKKVNVEFVSANPTGPMHLGNARGGALGDVLAEALDAAGYKVVREFYINDAGNQISKFGRSLAARYLQLVKGEDAVPFPEDGYQGEDITMRAREFLAANGSKFTDAGEDKLEQMLIDYALPKNIESLKEDLQKYRIEYDVWFRESTLHAAGDVRRVVQKLKDKGAAVEKDGAIWYCDESGDTEKDEVLVRANGVPTYFAADIAYHANKFERGFETLIDVWGADHHGHVARMKSALNALGYNGESLEIVLMQFVRLVQGGAPIKMSKRTGKAITLTSLLDEVPIDSARFFFNMHAAGSTMDFDLDLAVAEDSNNPVYYTQYAHARICSILRALAAENICLEEKTAFASLHLLITGEERALIRLIAAFPGEIAAAAQSREPARITRHLIELATCFHKFYTVCHIKGETEELLQARLALAVAAKTVLNNGLKMLKVNVPEKM